MRRHRASVLAVAALGSLCALVPVGRSAASPPADRPVFPAVISLPDGWRPEGIAAGRGTLVYSGSLATGDVLEVDVRTGAQRLAVDAPAGRVAVGIEQDQFGRFFVAGGGSGAAYVYAADGTPLATYQLAPSGQFINDVVVTRDAAWFTNSNAAALYRIPIGPAGELGTFEEVPLTGDFSLAVGFNLNGIEATADGHWLLAVQSATGRLFRIDPDTGETVLVDLGGATLPNGDGLLLQGRTLYVVQNQLNQVAVIELGADLTTGVVVDTITSASFRVPTTVARVGSRLYLVNARFGVTPTPTTEYEIVSVARA